MGALHHLNVGCADASIIQTATATFLVDCDSISEFAHLLPSDKRLRGVFITHQHHDHYSGLQYLRDKGFIIDHLIYSPYERRWDDDSVTTEEWGEFNNHRDYFARKGTKLHQPYRQASFKKAWWETNGVAFWVLGPHKHIANGATRELHDACLVIHAKMQKRRCLFTGDASDTLLGEIAATTRNICGDILHASHHGSINGAELAFIKNCNAAYTVISTAACVYDNVPHTTALKWYANHTRHIVYRTDTHGSLRWDF
jgi:beta-lactamase superfamily II metal-dependent hydrolase